MTHPPPYLSFLIWKMGIIRVPPYRLAGLIEIMCLKLSVWVAGHIVSAQLKVVGCRLLFIALLMSPELHEVSFSFYKNTRSVDLTPEIYLGSSF